MSKKNNTRKLSEVDWSHLTTTALEENDRCMGQLVGYVRYNDPDLGEISQLPIQLPETVLETGGIPAKQSKDGKRIFYKDERQRAFVKLPLNPDTKSGKQILDKFTALDKYYESPEGQKALFGSHKTKGYKYQPIVRYPAPPEAADSDDSDAEENHQVQNGLPYMKIKFDLDWNTGFIKTKIFQKNESGSEKKRSEVEITDLKSVEKYVRFRSSLTPVIVPSKVYASPPQGGVDGKKYGMVWKMKLVTVSGASAGRADLETENAFRSDDEEDDTRLSEDVRAVTKEEKQDLKEDSSDDDNDKGKGKDSDSDLSDSDSDKEKLEEKKVKKGRGKASTKST